MDFLSLGPWGAVLLGALFGIAAFFEAGQLPFVGDIEWTPERRRIAGGIACVLVVGGATIGAFQQTAGSASEPHEVSMSYWVGPSVMDYLSGSRSVPAEYEGFGLVGTAGSWSQPDPERVDTEYETLATEKPDPAITTETWCGEKYCVGTVFLVIRNEDSRIINDIEIEWEASSMDLSDQEVWFDTEIPAALKSAPETESIGSIRMGEGKLIPLAVVFYPAEGSAQLPLRAVGAVRLVNRLFLVDLDGKRHPIEVRPPAETFSASMLDRGLSGNFQQGG